MPRVAKSESQKELEKVKEQFDHFDEQVKSLTLDRMNQAPQAESEEQTKLSQKEIEKSPDIYLKPVRHLADGQKFNEKFSDKWKHAKEYVQFKAENREVIGENIEIWTHPFGGVGAEFWRVPVNKPVWGPRHLAEQISRCNYHVLIMDQTQTTGADGMGQYYGAVCVDKIEKRLDAQPVIQKAQVFMGASNF